jgi:hypothetical protein
MEGAFPGVGWSLVGNAPTQVGSPVHAGTKAVACNSTPSAGTIESNYRFTRRLRTGWKYRMEVWGRNTSTGTNRVRITNAETNNSLQTGGLSWGASAYCLTRTSSVYGLMTIDFTLESFYDCGRQNYATMYFDLTTNSLENVLYDDFDVWPMVDVVAVAGHNLDVSAAPQFRSSTDNFGASNALAATMAVKRPTFYSKLVSPVLDRYVQLQLPRANVRGIPKIGELFAGQAFTPARAVSALSPAEVTYNRRQVASDIQVFNLADEDERTLGLPMHLLTDAHFKEFRDEIVARCEGSRYPLFLVYDDLTDGETAVFGRLASASTLKRIPISQRETTLMVKEMPFATAVA